MKKDAYYFSHDSNAKDDPKCMLLIDQLGLEGYGIFWVLVEILRDQPEYKYPINLVPIIARRYNTTAEKMLTVVQKYDLFSIDNENNFFSFSLVERMQHLESVREQRQKAGIISGQIRAQKALNKCSTNVQQELNKNEQRKGKESKGKESKKSIIDISILFYETQLTESAGKNELTNYTTFVNYLKGQNSIKKPLIELLQMPQQVDYEQFVELLKLSTMNKKLIKDVMQEMTNNPKYYKNRKSLYLCIRKWLTTSFN